MASYSRSGILSRQAGEKPADTGRCPHDGQRQVPGRRTGAECFRRQGQGFFQRRIGIFGQVVGLATGFIPQGKVQQGPCHIFRPDIRQPLTAAPGYRPDGTRPGKYFPGPVVAAGSVYRTGTGNHGRQTLLDPAENDIFAIFLAPPIIIAGFARVVLPERAAAVAAVDARGGHMNETVHAFLQRQPRQGFHPVHVGGTQL